MGSGEGLLPLKGLFQGLTKFEKIGRRSRKIGRWVQAPYRRRRMDMGAILVLFNDHSPMERPNNIGRPTNLMSRRSIFVVIASHRRDLSARGMDPIGRISPQ